ncbi:MAG: prepilin-type N-terminal cleavage/methylation domain-containing protein [Candidatus Buchananbacteria bacterium]|nr:prepilin-type N-terminal cleavage/methylation domain-containing protein [Candidatus Buchananbacteria bacterium]
MVNKKGFTLIELLLYVAISSFLLLVISVFLSILLQSRIKNQVIAEVDQQGVQIIQIITQAIRNADIINSPTQGVNSTSLSLNTYNVGNNPTVFSLNSGVVRMTEGAGIAVDLNNSRVAVSNLSFYNLARTDTPGLIRISFDLTYINSSGRNEYDFSRTFYASAAVRQP